MRQVLTFPLPGDTHGNLIVTLKFIKEHNYLFSLHSQSLLLHYVRKHEALKDIIPPKEDLETSFVNCAKEQSTIQLSATEKCPSYHCNLCSFVTYENNFQKIVEHIAFKHYREDLHGMFGRSNSKCIRCGLQFSHESQLLAHYITQYGALKELILDENDLKGGADKLGFIGSPRVAISQTNQEIQGDSKQKSYLFT